ncbi:hypothetical protein COY90_01290 [Candidatus Roizmanbacteria bacterium CG_4_10_14_0_8_um_filter_39_9]|uniref:Transposase IS200-like domain-containing protein n=1 Tax=Candidatus Roizmanbacteria bacterium CG_4_10_14_0_8_um_filter_39_9 TaxID=1974829 RepID=A0A2M7QEN3_9BACT|nr:MAG: hypothetical protein COY90_01290 [Candidatus Roizmanbacteria bacterium CG_4_10_14_0_8_um_filter_39_9]
MPTRDDVFQNGDYYHIFNKTIDGKKIFLSSRVAYEFIRTFFYYRSSKATLRFSKFKDLPLIEQSEKEKQLGFKKYFRVGIMAYCLMPNHYHILLRQMQKNGVITFMANILNSITRYTNILNARKGPIFLTQFKSKKMHTEEQLVYVARYIHTNPFAGSIVSNVEAIFKYPYSSIQSYIHKNINNLETDLVMNYFKNDLTRFHHFIEHNADDQKKYEYLKYTDKWLV